MVFKIKKVSRKESELYVKNLIRKNRANSIKMRFYMHEFEMIKHKFESDWKNE